MKFQFDEADIPSPLRPFVTGLGQTTIEYHPQHEMGECGRCEEHAFLRPFPLVIDGKSTIMELCSDCQEDAVDAAVSQRHEQAGGPTVDLNNPQDAQGGRDLVVRESDISEVMRNVEGVTTERDAVEYIRENVQRAVSGNTNIEDGE